MIFPISGGMASSLAQTAGKTGGMGLPALGPLSMGLMGLGGLFSLGTDIVNQRKQAEYAERYWEQVSQASFRSAKRSYAQINRMESERLQQASQIMQNVLRQGQQARGEFTAGAGAAGVSGASVAALESDLMRQQMSRMLAESQNVQGMRAAMQEQRVSVSEQATSRITQAMNQYQPQDVDVFGSLFNIGASMLGTYAQTTVPTPTGRRFV